MNTIIYFIGLTGLIICAGFVLFVVFGILKIRYKLKKLIEEEKTRRKVEASYCKIQQRLHFAEMLINILASKPPKSQHQSGQAFDFAKPEEKVVETEDGHRAIVTIFKEGERVEITGTKHSALEVIPSFQYKDVEGSVMEIKKGYFKDIDGYQIGAIEGVFHPLDLKLVEPNQTAKFETYE